MAQFLKRVEKGSVLEGYLASFLPKLVNHLVLGDPHQPALEGALGGIVGEAGQPTRDRDDGVLNNLLSVLPAEAHFQSDSKDKPAVPVEEIHPGGVVVQILKPKKQAGPGGQRIVERGRHKCHTYLIAPPVATVSKNLYRISVTQAQFKAKGWVWHP